MATRNQGLPGMGTYAARLRRASRTLLNSRNGDHGVGRIPGAPSSITDTSSLIAVASIAGEAWNDIRPSVEMLRDEGRGLLLSVAAIEQVPVEWISAVISGLTRYTQASSDLQLNSVLNGLVLALQGCSVDDGWGETLHSPEISISQTARVVVALRQLLHFCNVAGEYGKATITADLLIDAADMLDLAMKSLLRHREHARGWRFRADSEGQLSYHATAECLLALHAAQDVMSPPKLIGGFAAYEVGAANVNPAEYLTVPVIIHESTWWLAQQHKSWLANFESDPDCVLDPWSRLSYAVVLEAALLGGQGVSGFSQSAKHLDSLWLEDKGLWGEWDGNIPMAAARGTYAAVRALDAVREALVRETTEGRVDLPATYEPVRGVVEEAGIAVSAEMSRVELILNGDKFLVPLAPDLISILRTVLDSGYFGITYQEIELATKVPLGFHSTYIKRINDAVQAKTVFRAGQLLMRVSEGKTASWRLNPRFVRFELDTSREGVA